MPIIEDKGALNRRKCVPKDKNSSNGISGSLVEDTRKSSCKPDLSAQSSKKLPPKIKPIQRTIKSKQRKTNTNRLSRMCFLSFTILVSTALLSYITSGDTYTVESRLTFVVSDEKAHRSFPLEKELQFLKNPSIMLIMAQKGELEPMPGEGGELARPSWCAAATASEQTDNTQLRKKFVGAGEFIGWVNDNLEIESASDGNKGVAKLKLQGDDPEFLKSMLNQYVKCYSDYRRSIEDELSVSPAREQKNTVSDELTEQLQKLELQYRECELALKLLDSGKGSFSGFVPESKSAIPSLAHFQKRIVELEIAKRGLNVRFTPNSREIKNIDYEIQQIREAMRECLAEHLMFLGKGKEMLTAQKQELERRAGYTEKCIKGKCSGLMPSGDAWFSVSEGLQIIQETPSITRKPLLARAQDLKKTLSSYLHLPFDSAEMEFFFGDHSTPILNDSDRAVVAAESTRLSQADNFYQPSNGR